MDWIRVWKVEIGSISELFETLEVAVDFLKAEKPDPHSRVALSSVWMTYEEFTKAID